MWNFLAALLLPPSKYAVRFSGLWFDFGGEVANFQHGYGRFILEDDGEGVLFSKGKAALFGWEVKGGVLLHFGLRPVFVGLGVSRYVGSGGTTYGGAKWTDFRGRHIVRASWGLLPWKASVSTVRFPVGYIVRLSSNVLWVGVSPGRMSLSMNLDWDLLEEYDGLFIGAFATLYRRYRPFFLGVSLFYDFLPDLRRRTKNIYGFFPDRLVGNSNLGIGFRVKYLWVGK